MKKSASVPLMPFTMKFSNDDEYERIHQAFENIKQKYRNDLGEKDIRYIKKIRRNSRIFEVIGRGLIHILPGPIALAGVPFLFLHRNLEAIEIGHNVLHGQYDSFDEIPQFHAKNFRWKAPVDETSWRQEHNAVHHVHTNVYEKDPDLNHGFLRVNSQVPHTKLHYFQVPIYLFLFYPFMLYNFNAQNLGVVDKFRAKYFPEGNKGYAVVDEALRLSKVEGKKRHNRAVWRVWIKEYFFFPLLALLTGFGVVKVFLANLLVDVLNSYWIALTIQATHFTEPLQPEDAIKNKGKWYVSQLDSSVNFRGNRWQSILWGHLNYQIEHHLFPDIPAHRYPDMSLDVQDVCKQFNLPYKCNSSWRVAIKKFIGAMWTYSFKNPSVSSKAAFLDRTSFSDKEVTRAK
ncbi:MAG: linoleoyl-CoA desaturase [Oleispira sp.]|jgi:linoleoyl-CoA desaturase